MSEEAKKTGAFGWDDEVDISDSFELIPDGDYYFEVVGMERGYYEPQRADSKIPACNEARLSLRIRWWEDDGTEHVSTVKYSLKLCHKLAFMIDRFFQSVGLLPKGDKKTRFPWGKVIGTTGICQIGHHETSQGNIFNDVVKCYPLEDAPRAVKNAARPVSMSEAGFSDQQIPF
jgi:hypothetical protein